MMELFLFHLSWGAGPERPGWALTRYLPPLLHQRTALGALVAHTHITQLQHAGCLRSLDPLPQAADTHGASTLDHKVLDSIQFMKSIICLCMHAKSLQSCLTLCDPINRSPPGSSVRGVLQARIWSGLPCPPPGDLSNPGIEPTSLTSPALAGGFLLEPPGNSFLPVMWLFSKCTEML